MPDEVADILKETPESAIDKHFDEMFARYLKRKGRMVGTAIILTAALITAIVGIVSGAKAMLMWVGISVVHSSH